jgi:hypothetical protein
MNKDPLPELRKADATMWVFGVALPRLDLKWPETASGLWATGRCLKSKDDRGLSPVAAIGVE